MTKIILATMVKNEDDIVREWIVYHASIFGYENIYIIDNYSTDNTFEICKEYVSQGIHLTREKDYRMKGSLMTEIKNKNHCNIFIPLDIDEFMVYYNKNTRQIEDNIVAYLYSLQFAYPTSTLFKMEYIQPLYTAKTDSMVGLDKFTHGSGAIMCYNNMAKTFAVKTDVNAHVFYNVEFDHGNHMGHYQYILSDLHLIHYHKRNHGQMLKKNMANIIGLGYPNNLKDLTHICKTNPHSSGIHHINHAIKLLENPDYNLDPPFVTELTPDMISLFHVIERIQTCLR